jgi:DNA (cytosine-5)-methyltransferase 1
MKVGSFCTGIGGAELALELMGLDHDLRWYSEVDKSACTVLAARFPGVANLGDLRAVDWHSVERVDVLTAGFPCQPFSLAGRRGGEDDERHLWPHIADAIGVLGPRLVLLENVAALTSLGGPAVVGTLAELGYCVRWTTLRASDVGACHGRNRWFCVATHPGSPGVGPVARVPRRA